MITNQLGDVPVHVCKCCGPGWDGNCQCDKPAQYEVPNLYPDEAQARAEIAAACLRMSLKDSDFVDWSDTCELAAMRVATSYEYSEVETLVPELATAWMYFNVGNWARAVEEARRH